MHSYKSHEKSIDLIETPHNSCIFQTYKHGSNELTCLHTPPSIQGSLQFNTFQLGNNLQQLTMWCKICFPFLNNFTPSCAFHDSSTSSNMHDNGQVNKWGFPDIISYTTCQYVFKKMTVSFPKINLVRQAPKITPLKRTETCPARIPASPPFHQERQR